MRLVATLLLLLTSLTAWAGIETKRGQLVELDSSLLELETHYGGIKFKEAIYGITYDAVREKYARLINDAVTLEEANGWTTRVTRDVLSPEQFRQLMIAMGAEFRDGHLNILRESRDGWTLGIRAAEVDGRLFVTGHNKDLYVSGTAIPLQVGDEIIAVDGEDVQIPALHNLPYQSLATYATRHAAAIESVINRGHRRLMPQQTGAAVRVTFARANPDGQMQVFEGVYHWLNVRTFQDDQALFEVPGQPAAPADEPFAYGTREKRSAFSEGLANMGMPDGVIIPTDDILNMRIVRAKEKAASGQALTPQEASVVQLDPVTRLAAYTVRVEGKTFGVIRIPDYMPAGTEAAVNELRWLAQVLQGFEATTDGLMIDQLANGGGMVMEVVQLARLFAAEEMQGVTIDMRMSRSLLSALESWGESRLTVVEEGGKESASSGVDRGEDIFGEQNYARVRLSRDDIARLRARWLAGEQWTGDVPFMGTHETFGTGEPGRILARQDGAFSKPVMIMTDSRSASGGDFFPALMQANGRALIWGETSMGLGMPVFRQTQTPGGELSMRCPFGMCTRPDGLPIENMAVVPDVPRYMAPEDLTSGFVNYTMDALAAMKLFVEGKTSAQIRAAQARRHPEVKSRKASFRALKGLFKGFATVAENTSDPAVLLNEYRGLVAAMGKVNSSDLTRAEWRQLVFPLPRLLTHADILLATFRRQGEVMERLGELARLPGISGDATLVALINEIRSALEPMPLVTFAGGCQDMLIAAIADPEPAAPAAPAGTPAP